MEFKIDSMIRVSFLERTSTSTSTTSTSTSTSTSTTFIEPFNFAQ